MNCSLWTCLIKLYYNFRKRKFLFPCSGCFDTCQSLFDMMCDALCVCVLCRSWPEVSDTLQELCRSTRTACWRSPPSSGSVEEEVFFCSSSSSSSSHTSVNPVTRTGRSSGCSCRCTIWSPESLWSAKRVRMPSWHHCVPQWSDTLKFVHAFTHFFSCSFFALHFLLHFFCTLFVACLVFFYSFDSFFSICF